MKAEACTLFHSRRGLVYPGGSEGTRYLPGVSRLITRCAPPFRSDQHMSWFLKNIWWLHNKSKLVVCAAAMPLLIAVRIRTSATKCSLKRCLLYWYSGQKKTGEGIGFQKRSKSNSLFFVRITEIELGMSSRLYLPLYICGFSDSEACKSLVVCSDSDVLQDVMRMTHPLVYRECRGR